MLTRIERCPRCRRREKLYEERGTILGKMINVKACPECQHEEAVSVCIALASEEADAIQEVIDELQCANRATEDYIAHLRLEQWRCELRIATRNQLIAQLRGAKTNERR